MKGFFQSLSCIKFKHSNSNAASSINQDDQAATIGFTSIPLLHPISTCHVTGTVRSASEHLTTSPIDVLPCEILREIFNHCIPQYPLKEQQPNTAIAPMLLCHICSTWRKIALEFPTLWSHLSLCFILFANNRSTPPTFVQSKVEFIRWWRKNHGSMAPSLSFSVRWITHKKILQSEKYRTEIIGFLVEYILSARYLQLDPLFWNRLRERCAQVKFGSLQGTAFLNFAPFTSPDAFPALLRLSISNGILPLFKKSGHIPLTHISLQNVVMSLNFWFVLLRTLPNLHFGYFNIRDMYNSIRRTEPPKYTLHQLSTLCVTFGSGTKHMREFDFGVLFINLHLPSVRTLALSWLNNEQRSDRDIIAALHRTLKSTPAVTTLALTKNFLPLVDPRAHVESLWHHTPHLEELQLEVPQEWFHYRTQQGVKEALAIFVRDALFATGGWLDLQNPACPIRAITIVDSELSSADDMSFGAGSNIIGVFMIERIRKLAYKVPRVVFRLTSKSVSDIAADEWND